MIRLHLVVEGQTEETFVRDVLAPDLWNYDITADVHRVTTGRRGGKPYRGGFVSYSHLKRDIELWTAQDRNADARFTSMVDLYRMPSDFPDLSNVRHVPDPIKRAELLEAAFAADIADPRFVPFLQVHEFEALLFSDPGAFAVAFPERDAELIQLRQIRSSVPTPEYIDDGESTSPAKRICDLFPDYQKPVTGALIAGQIGLATISHQCEHFRSWLERLRELG